LFNFLISGKSKDRMYCA